MNHSIIHASVRLYRALLKFYPDAFRQEFGEEMVFVFSKSLEDAGAGAGGITRLWGRTVVDLGRSLVIQHAENQRGGDQMNSKRSPAAVAGRVALATVAFLLLPLSATLFIDEFNWGLFDFVLTGALLFAAGLIYQLLASRSGNTVYRAAFAVAIATAAFLFFSNLAVGVIGSEDEPANVMYPGVIAVAVIGALLARFRPGGMARAMFVAALAQASTIAIALLFGMHRYPESSVLEIFKVNGFFIVLWVVSGLLFRWASESGYRLESETAA